MKDTIYRSTDSALKPFEFDQKVADVFPDMIKRSVPGYPLTISMISVLADNYVQDGSNIYDLGCSLGAVTFAIQQSVNNKKCNIIAVDNSKAMLDACSKIDFQKKPGIEIQFQQDDITHVEIKNASVIVLNFTLQFVPPGMRQTLLENIYHGLLPGGVLILSEKIHFDDENEDFTMTELHHHMKELNGYEKMEIANKREALEKVLIPETIEVHQQRLKEAGFKQSYMWLRCLNFMSIIAIK